MLIHTNQGPHLPNQHPDHSAEALAVYLTSTGDTADPVSYHVVVDDDSLINYLDDSQESWSAFSANPVGLHLCLVGLAEWSRSQWLEHMPMLTLAAQKVSEWCSLHRIPIIHRSPAETAHGDWGIISHADWTYAQKMLNPDAPDSHTDPGSNFPWDLFIPMVAGQSPKKGKSMILERKVQPGKGIELFEIPVGKASQIVARAWVSSGVLGPSNGAMRYWFQDDSKGLDDSRGAITIPFSNGHSGRYVMQFPDGTTQLRAEYSFPDGGVIAIELETK